MANALVRLVGAALVRGDDFYRVMDDDHRAKLSPIEGVDLYDDWQRLRDQVLIPLRAGRTARFQPYDWARNTLSSMVSMINTAPVVVVEGLFFSRPQLADLFEVSILVTADASTRQHRQQIRADASAECLQRWEAAERWYFDNVRPPASFDTIVTGTAQDAASIAVVRYAQDGSHSCPDLPTRRSGAITCCSADSAGWR